MIETGGLPFDNLFNTGEVENVLEAQFGALCEAIASPMGVSYARLIEMQREFGEFFPNFLDGTVTDSNHQEYTERTGLKLSVPDIRTLFKDLSYTSFMGSRKGAYFAAWEERFKRAYEAGGPIRLREDFRPFNPKAFAKRLLRLTAEKVRYFSVVDPKGLESIEMYWYGNGVLGEEEVNLRLIVQHPQTISFDSKFGIYEFDLIIWNENLRWRLMITEYPEDMVSALGGIEGTFFQSGMKGEILREGEAEYTQGSGPELAKEEMITMAEALVVSEVDIERLFVQFQDLNHGALSHFELSRPWGFDYFFPDGVIFEKGPEVQHREI